MKRTRTSRVSAFRRRSSRAASIDLLQGGKQCDVVIFGVPIEEDVAMRLAVRACVLGVVGLVLAVGAAKKSEAQADYPFRDTSISDSARIQDLLKRLTLDEKVLLMSDHPKIPRLGIVFSGQVEG